MALPQATKAPSAVLSKAAASTDATFHVLYFNLFGRGELTRTILAYVGAKWDELPVTWADQKAQTRFGVIPVVFEEHADGTVLELAESQAIERYLARKFNLLGSNLWEEHLVNEFFSSTDQLNIVLTTTFLPATTPEARVEAYNKIVDNQLPVWIAQHEKHLAANEGGNGHYVGNKTTLADLKTHLQIERLLLFQPKDAKKPPLSPELTPNLWKLKETVEKESKTFQEWRSSARFEELVQGTRSLFKL
ncbi:hypothetical protein BGZ73_006417 [Actinomortierella ambigua]|nr:hypothetical protein BGZ73_006417 [Actinomortierella ambigua]